MQPITFFLFYAFSILTVQVQGWPHMAKTMDHLHRHIARADGNDDGDGEKELLGDLKTAITSPTGQSVANILLGNEPGQSTTGGYRPPGLLGTKACKADTCCVWWYVSAALTLAFKGPTGRCNDNARAAIRLGFHDAGTWSKSKAAAGQDFGGADGSIVLSGSEKNRPDNNGLQTIIGLTKIWATTYGVGVGDLIQFAANHAVVTCPLGPRVRTFVGRKDSSTPAPEGLLPGVNDGADKLVSLFQDKTISPHMLAALVGAHSASRQFNVDPSRRGAPQDGTPGIWDVRFYNQTTSANPPPFVFRFKSDIDLANDPRLSDEWQAFSSPVNGQDHWNEDYASAYVRLSMLGVNNINDLTECTKVLPPYQPTFLGASLLGLFD